MPKPQITWLISPHHNLRPGGEADVDTIVLHHTAGTGSARSTALYFADPKSKVSSHYVIGKDGAIVQCVQDAKRAWHAGQSAFRGRGDVNDFSIGIELVNRGDGKDPFPDPQYWALADLVAYLMQAYRIPAERVVGHRDVALPPGRKTDPASNFDWARLRRLVGDRQKPAAPRPVSPAPPAAAPAPAQERTVMNLNAKAIPVALNVLAGVAVAAEASTGFLKTCCGEGWYYVAVGALALLNGIFILATGKSSKQLAGKEG
jgi:N-acetylmuramoyl-L-alanine amidase CwlA